MKKFKKMQTEDNAPFTPDPMEYFALIHLCCTEYLTLLWEKFLHGDSGNAEVEESVWAHLKKVGALDGDNFYEAVTVAALDFRELPLVTGMEMHRQLLAIFIYGDTAQRAAVTATMQKFTVDGDLASKNAAINEIFAEVRPALPKEVDIGLPPELEKRMWQCPQCGTEVAQKGGRRAK